MTLRIFFNLVILFILILGPETCFGIKRHHRPPHRDPLAGDCTTVICPATARCIAISDPCFERPCLESTVCVPIRKDQPPADCTTIQCPVGTHCVMPPACLGLKCPPSPPPECQKIIRHGLAPHPRPG